MTVLRSRNDVNLLVCFIHMFFSLDFYTFELKKKINVKNIISSVVLVTTETLLLVELVAVVFFFLARQYLNKDLNRFQIFNRTFCNSNWRTIHSMLTMENGTIRRYFNVNCLDNRQMSRFVKSTIEMNVKPKTSH